MSEKVEYTVRHVPRDESGRLELLALRPPLWEYLLFGNVLYVSRAFHEARWRDYQMGYTLKVGTEVPSKEIFRMLSERLTHVVAIVQNLDRIPAPAAQERAFGEEDGDATLIEHMATRLIDVYGLLLGWVEETRALRVPDRAERLKELLIAHTDQPLRRTYEFVDEFIDRLEQAIARLADGRSEFEEITIRITYEIDDNLIREYQRELRRVKRHFR
jgi:hypothetical protein